MNVITPLQHDDERGSIVMDAYDKSTIAFDSAYDEVIDEMNGTVHNLSDAQINAFALEVAIEEVSKIHDLVPVLVREAEINFVSLKQGDLYV